MGKIIYLQFNNMDNLYEYTEFQEQNESEQNPISVEIGDKVLLFTSRTSVFKGRSFKVKVVEIINKTKVKGRTIVSDGPGDLITGTPVEKIE